MPDETLLTKADYDTAIEACYMRARRLESVRDLRFPLITDAQIRGTMLDFIVEKVSRSQGLEAKVVTSRTRTQHVAATRQLAMYVARNLGCGSYPEIGARFGRDHSTVIHACNLIGRQMLARPAYGNMIRRLLTETAAAMAPLEGIAA